MSIFKYPEIDLFPLPIFLAKNLFLAKQYPLSTAKLATNP